MAKWCLVAECGEAAMVLSGLSLLMSRCERSRQRHGIYILLALLNKP